MWLSMELFLLDPEKHKKYSVKFGEILEIIEYLLKVIPRSFLKLSIDWKN